MAREELESWIREERKKVQVERDSLPFDPTPEAIKRHQELLERDRFLWELKAKFCPPPKPKPDPELEDLLY